MNERKSGWGVNQAVRFQPWCVAMPSSEQGLLRSVYRVEISSRKCQKRGVCVDYALSQVCLALASRVSGLGIVTIHVIGAESGDTIIRQSAMTKCVLCDL
jgi:hypothetical protein